MKPNFETRISHHHFIARIKDWNQAVSSYAMGQLDSTCTAPTEHDEEHGEEQRHPAVEKEPNKLYTRIIQNARIVSMGKHCTPQFVQHRNS